MTPDDPPAPTPAPTPAAGRRANTTRRITIVDVAREAGVSIRTVSRVLNAERDVSAARREHVQAVIDRLAFVPSAAARALPGARSYTVALLFERLSANYLLDLQLAAVRSCHANGHHLMVEEIVPEEVASPDTAQAVIAELAIDAAVLLPPACDNIHLLDALEARGIRYTRVAPAAMLSRSPAVTFDDGEATAAMVRLLAELGHRRIGFVVGDVRHASAHTRLAAFEATLAELGLPRDPELVHPGDYGHGSGVVAGRVLLALPDRPTAIFASNDAMAAGVISAAGMLGIATPHDLSVCGFDDSALSRHIWPALTTIRQPLAEMATVAVEQALFPRKRDRIIPFAFELIVRSSTMARAGEGAD